MLDLLELLKTCANPSPLLMMTGNIPQDIALKIEQWGKFHILEKPFRSQKLLDLVQNIILETTEESQENDPINALAT